MTAAVGGDTMVSSLLGSLAAAGVILLTGCATLPRDRPDANASPSALMRQAQDARDEGRIEEAVKDYERVAVSSLPNYERRAEALFWAGMLRLSADPAVRDLDQGRRSLEELTTSYPRSPYARQATIVAGLAAELSNADERIEGAKSASTESLALCENDKADLTARLETSDTALADARAESKTAKAEAEKCHMETTSLKKELEEKDEALKKVKEVLLNWKPKR